MSKLKELREQRKQLHEQSVAEMNKPQTAETRAKVDQMIADIDVMTADIQRIEKADKMAEELRTAPVADPNVTADLSDPKVIEMRSKEYRQAFAEMLTRGVPGSPRTINGGARPEAMQVLHDAKSRLTNSGVSHEQRDQQAGTQSISYTQGTLGGFFVPAGFVYDIERATKYYAPLLDGTTIRVMETATGQVLPYPKSNDTNEAWTIVGEAVQVNDGGTTPNYPNQGVTAPAANPGNVLAAQTVFNAWKGSTGLVKVSLEILQDSAFNIEQFLTESFAIRQGRGYEWYLTQGTGTNQPTGILPAIAASGAVTITAQGSSSNDGSSNTGANSIGYQDLVNLIHSVDPTYRRGAKFMLHDQTLRFLKTLLDKFGRPLWVPSARESEPDTLAGYPYVINQSFPQIAASAVTVAFGAWQKYICRKVRDLQVLRLDERFADFGEVAYIAFSRIDGNLVDAGTHPLNTLTQHS